MDCDLCSTDGYDVLHENRLQSWVFIWQYKIVNNCSYLLNFTGLCPKGRVRYLRVVTQYMAAD